MDKSRLHFDSQLPSARAFPPETVLFYDSILAKNKKLRPWLKSFHFQIPLKSGEKLKTLASCQVVLKKMRRLNFPQTTALTFLAVGGGSVGDFVGFLASIYLRGRNLIHIPSTWLAAVDSAHGGKTALNFEFEKNQLGTFYAAKDVYIVNALLKTQPRARLQDALGEVIKIAIINDPKVFSSLEKNVLHYSSDDLFRILPTLIRNKLKVVEQDQFEKYGLRRVLNLGHTIGHVLESYHGWPHGLCVVLGILFSVRWSYHLDLMREDSYVKISNLIEEFWPQQNLASHLAEVPLSVLKKKLLKDKKLTSKSEIDFIFIQKIGLVVRRRVKVEAILEEVKRQIEEY